MSSPALPTAFLAPERGTRPSNRHALIVAAATQLFHRNGYSATSMGDIAAAVNVQPSALYRHFPSKEALLAETIRLSLQPLTQLLEQSAGAPHDIVLKDVVRIGLLHRASGVLWQREAHYLDATTRAEVRAALRQLARLIAERIGNRRPQLTPGQGDQLAWSAMAALGSISFHDLNLPPAAMESTLLDLLRRILSTTTATATHTDMHTHPETTTVPAGLIIRSRREIILAAASNLFTERGYASVTVDEVGEAAGIAGPSIYNHFASKPDLLAAVLTRADEWLWMELTRALATACDEADALARLLDSYIALTMERPEVITVLVGDLPALSTEMRHRFRESQHDYITECASLLQAVRPDLGATAARIEVQAALTIVNNVAQTPHLRRSPEAVPLLRATMTSILSGSGGA
jgi:AcrR family transcriptional regulator